MLNFGYFTLKHLDRRNMNNNLLFFRLMTENKKNKQFSTTKKLIKFWLTGYATKGVVILVLEFLSFAGEMLVDVPILGHFIRI